MRRFPASVSCAHRATLSSFVGQLPPGGCTLTFLQGGVQKSIVVSAQEDQDLRDLAGALNFCAAQPGGCDDAPPPTPPPNGIEVIANGDYARRLYTPGHSIVSWAFYVPVKGLLYGSASENPAAMGGAPALRILTVSRAPGDVSPAGALVYSRGKQATCYITPGVEAAPGDLLYFNTQVDEPVEDDATGSGFSIVWIGTQ